jgi:hypothetical protein
VAGTRHASKTRHQGNIATVSSLQALLDLQLTMTPDIIDSWDEVDKLSDLPKEKLCSDCLVNKYATMRQNAYGVYDEESWKPRYDTIVKSEP